MKMKRVELVGGSKKAMSIASDLANKINMSWEADNWKSNAIEMENIRIMRQAIGLLPGEIVVVEYEA